MKSTGQQQQTAAIFEISRDGKTAFFLGRDITNCTTPGKTIPFLQENQPVNDQARKRVPGSFKPQTEFKTVVESLCTAEVYFLRNLNQTSDEDLTKAREEILNLIHIAGQIRNRITETISGRQQEDIF